MTYWLIYILIYEMFILGRMEAVEAVISAGDELAMGSHLLFLRKRKKALIAQSLQKDRSLNCERVGNPSLKMMVINPLGEFL